jgi:hypothetical protein
MKAKLLLALIVSLLFCGSVQANPTFMALSVSPGETFEFDVVTTQVVSGLFSTTGSILVDWGDGNSNSYNGTDQVWSHDYGDAIGTRTVTITNAGALTKYRMDAVGANVQFALSDLPSGVVYFICYGSNTISGSLSDLPSGVVYFICTGSNTVSGSLSDLPSGVTAFYCSGSNTVSDYTTKTWTTKPATFKVIPLE